MKKEEYISALINVIRKTHGLTATHTGTASIRETIEGKPIWEGEVEVFQVHHAKADQCFAWGYVEDGEFKAVAVLGEPPIITPQKAVQAFIVSQES